VIAFDATENDYARFGFAKPKGVRGMDNSHETLEDRNAVTGWDTEYARQPGKILLRIFSDAYGPHCRWSPIAV